MSMQNKIQVIASNGGRRGQKLFALQAKTTFGHRKSGKHERIRLPFKRERIAAHLTVLAMTERQLTAHTTRYSWQLKDLSF